MKHSRTRKPVSILILYHNGEAYLRVCLQSLLETVAETDEILVLVNNQDISVHQNEYHHSRVRYIHIYENLGYGKATNQAATYATYEHIIICDHDLVFYPGWIDALWDFYQSDPLLAAVCCKIIDTQNDNTLDIGIAFSGFNFTHPFMDLPTTHALVSKNRYAQMVCTGGLLIKKELFISTGGMDESFGSLYTDLDLSLRLKQQGLLVGTCASAIARHFAGELFQGDKPYKASFLKSDVKGAFMKKNAEILSIDLDIYYKESIAHFLMDNELSPKYFYCNMMNVVNAQWYEDVAEQLGIKRSENIRYATGSRDAGHIRLLDHLGYDIMIMGMPIAYIVDRFCSVIDNSFWWEQRRISEKDIVIDRNANIQSIGQLLTKA